MYELKIYKEGDKITLKASGKNIGKGLNEEDIKTALMHENKYLNIALNVNIERISQLNSKENSK